MMETELTKTIDIKVAGTLNNLLLAENRHAITNLTITGIIDARDFFYIRDEMPKVSTLDISSVTILSFEDNNLQGNNYYSANEIPQNALHDCRNLTTVTIPEGLISIANEAFSWCTCLKQIMIPKSVSFIADSSFSCCFYLTAINVQTENLFYTSLNGILFNKDQTTLIHYPRSIRGESYSIPNGVVTIGNFAFMSCNIETIILNSEIKSIGAYAFKDCERLTNIVFPDELMSIGDFAFNGCKRLVEIIIADGVISLGNNAFCGCDELTSITIGGGVSCIKKGTFSYCYRLSIINIPNSVALIEEGAFSNCNNLKTVTIGTGVSVIGDLAFSNCNNLNTLTIGAGVSVLGSDIFKNCSKLIEINTHPSNINYSSIDGILFNKDKTKFILYPFGKQETIYSIPFGVTIIGTGAFESCNTLTKIKIPDGVIYIEARAFHNCRSLNDIVLPNSIKKIEENAFGSCRKLSNLLIGSGVTLIGDSAFSDCNIKSIAISDNVISIGESAFSSCDELTEVKIGNGVEFFGDNPFGSCNKLQRITVQLENQNFSSINGVLFNKTQTKLIQYPCGKLGTYTIPNSVNIIASYAFNDCIELPNIIIGNGVSFIGNGAFHNCRRLLSVVIPNGVTSIENEVFRNCSGLLNMVIPNEVTSIGDYAFCECSNLKSVTIGSGVTSIGECAFKFCALKTIYSLNTTPPTLNLQSFDNTNHFADFIENAPNVIVYVSIDAIKNYQTEKNWIDFFQAAFIKSDVKVTDKSQQKITVNPDNNKTIAEENLEEVKKFYSNRFQEDISRIQSKKEEIKKPIVEIIEHKVVEPEHKVIKQEHKESKQNNGCFFSVALVLIFALIIGLM